MTAWRTVPQTQRPGRHDPIYIEAVKQVAERALAGEGCWFHTYGKCRYDGAGFDWGASRTALSFSAHHLERVMDGGKSAVGSDKLVPSHRGCNAADGLRAQNARRAARKRGDEYDPSLDDLAITHALSAGLTRHIPMTDPTSRNW